MEKVSNVSVKVANPCVVYVRDNLEKLCRPFLRFWYKEMSVCSPDFATNQPASPARNIVSRGISRQKKSRKFVTSITVPAIETKTRLKKS